MKPKRSIWKLITVFALATTISLCVCATISLPLLRGDRSILVRFGSFAVHIISHNGNPFITDDTIVIGPDPNKICEANAPITLGDTEFYFLQCVP
jgi:hypothetical protein